MGSSKVPLVLASSSPRRKDLLTEMGCVFKVQHASIDESRLENELAAEYVNRLAKEKAEEVKQQYVLNSIEVAILAADTIVCHGETVFSKPKNKDDAFRIWQQLSNSQHNVITAVCLMVCDKVSTRLVSTMVEFIEINETQMHQYWSSGEPLDKAGAYAIQGLASAWVKLIHGSYSNVVGLPLRETNKLLKEVDHNWL